MSLQQLKVFIHELEVGMFVSALDKPWAETPFPIQGFLIKSAADASRVKAYCDYIYIDISKGISPLDLKSPSAGSRQFNNDLRNKAQDINPIVRGLMDNRQLAAQPNFVIKPDIYRKTVELSKEMPAARRVMNNLVGCLSVATRQITKGAQFNLHQLQQSVDDMVDSVVRCPDAFTWLLQLRAKDRHTHDHSIRSALWATQFARHIGLELDQLKDLCLAALLKDIGKSGMDRSLLRKSDRNEEEEAEYRGFVSASIDKLRQSDFDNRRVMNIIKFHCERFDGSGFPKGCSGQRIPFLAAIVGIASEFDRLCNPREVSAVLTPSKATGRLYELRGHAFAEDLVVEFIQSVGLYPAGTLVELTTGDQGMVIEQNPKSRLSPRLAVFDSVDGKTNPENYIFVDLKNEDKARAQLQKFGTRRAYDVAKLAIVKDVDSERLGVDEKMLNLLISKPFSVSQSSGLLSHNQRQSDSNSGFFAALKQRLLG
ncbi:Cyclic di-GMP phosphodiesterase response regulator RpfG [Gammaproteobacteria bacterium MOLA455]|nr:Cyclic di-GMP phosphodiesterase response regulator RpfG [Gammaproteobacteria bacterium MOLA455]